MGGYNITDYGRFIADRVRTDAYANALRRAVTPGSVVVDIGTGTGIFALLACQFGARRVYAIEPGDAILVAREIAAANGCADRIEFIRKPSTDVTLPERANVIVSDLRGVLPWFQQHLPSIVDARQRFLAPGGAMIPQSDTLWAAVADAHEVYERCTDPWDESRYGLDMRAARRMVSNRLYKHQMTPEQLLVEPLRWAMLDYGTVERPDVRADLTWTASREGTAHGLVAWFDATVAEGIPFSNAPGQPEHIYGNAFFPWLEPVRLAAGDTVSAVLRADLIAQDYTWRWTTRVLDPEGRVKATFDQSTFFGVPLSPSGLLRQDASHRPLLDEDGQIDLLILEQMSGAPSLLDIARQMSAQFPCRFPKLADALSRVRELSNKYGKATVTRVEAVRG